LKLVIIHLAHGARESDGKAETWIERQMRCSHITEEEDETGNGRHSENTLSHEDELPIAGKR
jgi:hypothetical protein